ncbi:MAG: hypothetical protein F6J96_34095 [Symploca sp. SIO1C2]|nr:hypothetical protein [Symploca sp. SIO1C2]
MNLYTYQIDLLEFKAVHPSIDLIDFNSPKLDFKVGDIVLREGVVILKALDTTEDTVIQHTEISSKCDYLFKIVNIVWKSVENISQCVGWIDVVLVGIA